MRLSILLIAFLLFSLSLPLTITGCNKDGSSIFISEGKTALRKLKNESATIRERAAYSLSRGAYDVQKEALPVLIDLVNSDESDDVRIAALTAIAHILGDPVSDLDIPESFDFLPKSVADENPLVRAESIKTLGRIYDQAPFLGESSPENIESWQGLLIQGLNDGSPLVRLNAVNALKWMRHDVENLNQILMRVLTDDDPDVRFAAAEAILAEDETAEGMFDILLEGFNDPLKQRRAMEHLANFGSQASVIAPQLEKIISNIPPEPSVIYYAYRNVPDKQQLLDFLRTERPDSLVLAYLEAQNPDSVEFNIFRGFYDIGIEFCWDNGREESLFSGKHSDEMLHSQAIATLAKVVPEEEFTSAIIDLYESEIDANRKKLLLLSIGRVGTAASPLVPMVTPLVESPDALIKVAAAFAIARCGGDIDNSIRILIESLDSDETAVRLLAVNCLGDMFQAATDALPQLAQMEKKDPSKEVQHAAKMAVISIDQVGQWGCLVGSPTLLRE